MSPDLLTALLAAHAGATVMMAGLIWFVQVVHYPLFAAVGTGSFVAYEAQHVRRTGLVVGPIMLVEAGTALALPFVLAPGPERWLAWTGLALVAGLWMSTARLQVPCHRRLERRFDGRAVRRLVSTNWLRTVLWSARGAIALVLLARGGSP